LFGLSGVQIQKRNGRWWQFGFRLAITHYNRYRKENILQDIKKVDQYAILAAFSGRQLIRVQINEERTRQIYHHPQHNPEAIIIIDEGILDRVGHFKQQVKRITQNKHCFNTHRDRVNSAMFGIEKVNDLEGDKTNREKKDDAANRLLFNTDIQKCGKGQVLK
jgi:hypothetical protein